MKKLIDKLNMQGIYGQDLHIIELTGIAFTGWAIPLFNHILELFQLSADFNSFCKQFHILGPMALRLLEPKVT